MSEASMTLFKTAMDMYQTQYTATDRLWGYFSAVSLALVAYMISSEKVRRVFPEAIAVLAAYLVFCVGNFQALCAAQRQLLALAETVRHYGRAAGVRVDSFEPFSVENLSNYYGGVVLAICAATLLLAWYRGRPADESPPASGPSAKAPPA